MLSRRSSEKIFTLYAIGISCESDHNLCPFTFFSIWYLYTWLDCLIILWQKSIVCFLCCFFLVKVLKAVVLIVICFFDKVWSVIHFPNLLYLFSFFICFGMLGRSLFAAPFRSLAFPFDRSTATKFHNTMLLYSNIGVIHCYKLLTVTTWLLCYMSKYILFKWFY